MPSRRQRTRPVSPPGHDGACLWGSVSWGFLSDTMKTQFTWLVILFPDSRRLLRVLESFLQTRTKSSSSSGEILSIGGPASWFPLLRCGSCLCISSLGTRGSGGGSRLFSVGADPGYAEEAGAVAFVYRGFGLWGRAQGPRNKSQAPALCFWVWLARVSDTREHLSFHTPLSCGFNYILDSEPRNEDSRHSRNS